MSDLFRYWLARKPRVQLEPEDNITFKGIPVVSCFLQPGPMSSRCHSPQVEELSITEDTRLGSEGHFLFRPGLCFSVVLSSAATTVHREDFRSAAANEVKCGGSVRALKKHLVDICTVLTMYLLVPYTSIISKKNAFIFPRDI